MSLKSHSRRHSKGTGLSERWLHSPPLFTWLTHGSALLFSWRGEVTRPVRANRLRLYLNFKLSPAYADHALVWSRCKWLNAGYKHWKCWHLTLCNRNTEVPLHCQENGLLHLLKKKHPQRQTRIWPWARQSQSQSKGGSKWGRRLWKQEGVINHSNHGV